MARALRASEINLSCLSQGARARLGRTGKPAFLRVDRGGPWWTVPWTVRGPLVFYAWTVVDCSFKRKN